MCTHLGRFFQRPEEGIQSPSAGVTGPSRLVDVQAGNENRSSASTQCALSHWYISPASIITTFKLFDGNSLTYSFFCVILRAQ